MSVLERVVVTYWKMQGGGLAAPVVMLCYYIGQPVLEDYMDKERWETCKDTARWGQLPLIELEYQEGVLEEGTKQIFTNSDPTLRALGRMWGYYFTELKQKFRYETDMWLDVSTDCLRSVYPTFKLDKEEKLLARQELISEGGKLYNWFNKFDLELKTLLNDEEDLVFLVNNKVSIADFKFFCTVNSIVCGWLDGIDKTFLAKFPHLNLWYTKFLEHYSVRMAKRPKKAEYPYIVHNGRYYVNGKDQTEFWTDPDRIIPGENGEKGTFDINLTGEELKKENIKKEVKKEILTKESTLLEVESASVKVLKNTLIDNGQSINGIVTKTELIGLVKQSLGENFP